MSLTNLGVPTAVDSADGGPQKLDQITKSFVDKYVPAEGLTRLSAADRAESSIGSAETSGCYRFARKAPREARVVQSGDRLAPTDAGFTDRSTRAPAGRVRDGVGLDDAAPVAQECSRLGLGSRAGVHEGVEQFGDAGRVAVAVEVAHRSW
jgi:hypothetical protein